MSPRTLFAAVAIVSVTALVSTQVSSNSGQPDKPTTPAGHPDAAMHNPTPEQMAAGMKAWQEAMTPDAHHKFLEQMVGEWETTTKIMGMPGAEAMESKGRSTLKMALGGRFLQQEVDGQMMGMPMQGVGFTGYDKFKKRYVATWMDSMGTQILTMTGNLDQTGKVLTMYGLMDEPMTGEHDKTVKYVTRIVDANSYVFEIYDLAGGDTLKVVEITNKRKIDATK